MKVFKFGGASVKNAENIKNVAGIIQSFKHEKLMVVVSAMGSTTDALETLIEKSNSNHDYAAELNAFRSYHEEIANKLFIPDHILHMELRQLFTILEAELTKKSSPEKYDQVISHGELISSVILYNYLSLHIKSTLWADARQYICTDDTLREGKVDWIKTEALLQADLNEFNAHDVVVTQGFIGRGPRGYTTTLGREGSDFTAAILASCLNAESLTVWKDVPGLMNADPKRLPDAVVLKELPYSEAAEMMYYGANLIHTKTIRPLATKKIPLYVKSFIDPSLPGSNIHDCHIDELPTMFVFKDNQCLVSCKVTDYTFISEYHLQEIFALLNQLGIRFNMVQHSAITFSFCFDYHAEKLQSLLKKMRQTFEVYYNLDLTLITIKNYTPEVFTDYRNRKGILLEQSSRSTLQLLLKSTE
jgi:aspartate kinase